MSYRTLDPSSGRLVESYPNATASELANGTPFGLGASLWTKDRSRVARIVPRLEVGSVFVNGMVKSDPRFPFGGVKDSGLGRELGREALLEFANTKTLWIGEIE